MTLCLCERCGQEFPPLAHLTEHVWICADCWRKAGAPSPSKLPTAEEVQARELATRNAMLNPGDRLWVKERISLFGDLDASEPATSFYDADMTPTTLDRWPWKLRSLPGMFCPQLASRITLEITEVRVQRLQEISEEDAKAEGVTADLLREMLQPLAARAKPLPLHWIAGADDGENFCRPCCEKRVAKLPKKSGATVGGGYDSEEDSSRMCADCGALLDFTLTSYGARQELEHFAENGIASDPVNAFCALAMVDSGACPEGPLARVGYRFLWDSLNGKRAPWSSNPWTWALTFRRVVPA